MSQRVILVGHCGIDGPRLQQEIASKDAGLDVVRVNDAAELDALCDEGACLLLVNREPVGFEQEGVEIIRDVCKRHPGQKVMLVSDFAEAQEQAVKVGALPGFGKADIGKPKLMDSIRQALAGAPND